MGRIVSIEIDLLNDFINPDGLLPVPEAHTMRENLIRLAQFMDVNKVIRIAARDSHFYDDPELKRNGGLWPDHAMFDTEGKNIIDEMSFPAWPIIISYIKEYNTAAHRRIAARVLDRGYRYLCIEKRDYSMLSNTNASPVLKTINVDRAIVSGVATDLCVKHTVVDLQKEGIQCYVVEDVIAGLVSENVNPAIEEMKTAGARFVKLSDLGKLLNGELYKK